MNFDRFNSFIKKQIIANQRDLISRQEVVDTVLGQLVLHSWFELTGDVVAVLSEQFLTELRAWVNGVSNGQVMAYGIPWLPDRDRRMLFNFFNITEPDQITDELTERFRDLVHTNAKQLVGLIQEAGPTGTGTAK